MYLLTNGNLIWKVLVDPYSCGNSVQWPLFQSVVAVLMWRFSLGEHSKKWWFRLVGGEGGAVQSTWCLCFASPMPATFHLSLSNENTPEQANNTFFSSLSLSLFPVLFNSQNQCCQPTQMIRVWDSVLPSLLTLYWKYYWAKSTPPPPHPSLKGRAQPSHYNLFSVHFRFVLHAFRGDIAEREGVPP